MKRIRTLYLLFFSAWLLSFTFSCKKDPEISTDALAYIPHDASLVAAFNLKSIAGKTDRQSLEQLDVYQDNGHELFGNVLAEMVFFPERSGIHPKNKMYLATVMHENNPEETATYLFFTLENEEEFRRRFKENEDKIQEVNGVSLLEVAQDVWIAWNEYIMVLADAPGSEHEIREKMTAVFSMPPGQSMAENENLQKALDNTHDFSAWLSFDQLAANPAAGMGLSLAGINPAEMKSNFIHLHGNFEQDRMVGHADFFINKAMGEKIIGRFFNKKIDTDFSGVLPEEGFIFAAAAALDPAGMHQFFQEHPQMGDFINNFLKSLALERAELPQIFSGDLLIAGMNSREDELPGIMVQAKLAHPQKARAMLNRAASEGRLFKTGDEDYEISIHASDDQETAMRFKIIIRDGRLLFYTSKKLYEKLSKSAVTGNNKLKISNDHAVVLLLDFNGLREWTEQDDPHFSRLELYINDKGADFTVKSQNSSSHSLHDFYRLLNEFYLQGPNRYQDAW